MKITSVFMIFLQGAMLHLVFFAYVGGAIEQIDGLFI